MRHTFSAFFLLLLVTGCVREKIQSENSFSKPVASQAAGKTTETTSKTRPLHSTDVVILRVVPGKEFEKDLELTVNLDGEILVPLVGWVKVEEMTTREAEEKIKQLLDKDYIVNPSVSLRIKEASSRAVVLLGQVKKPGTYEFPPSGKMTLLEAVAKAEGFTDIANLSKVKIVRAMPDGTQKTLRLNAEKLLSGEEADLELQEGDLITVPETVF